MLIATHGLPSGVYAADLAPKPSAPSPMPWTYTLQPTGPGPTKPAEPNPHHNATAEQVSQQDCPIPTPNIFCACISAYNPTYVFPKVRGLLLGGPYSKVPVMKKTYIYIPVYNPQRTFVVPSIPLPAYCRHLRTPPCDSRVCWSLPVLDYLA